MLLFNLKLFELLTLHLLLKVPKKMEKYEKINFLINLGLLCATSELLKSDFQPMQTHTTTT